MGKKVFTVLENNPEVLNHLAHNLGLSNDLAFHDVYSLHDPELLSLIPRPVYALIAIIPLTDAWNQSRLAEDASQPWYTNSGASEPVIWFHQTITHGCGSIALLHCASNSHVASMIAPNSPFDKLIQAAIPLKMSDRAQLLEDSDELYAAHQEAAIAGDTQPPDCEAAHRLGQHFVAFVKGKDGHLWELEGARKGPIDRGVLGEDEDVLSEKAVELSLGRVIEMERKSGGGDLRFSCVALGPRTN